MPPTARQWRRLRKDAEVARRLVGNLLAEVSAPPTDRLDASLSRTLKRLKAAFGLAGDLVVRPFRLGGPGERKAAVIYLDGMVDARVVHEDILNSLQKAGAEPGFVQTGVERPSGGLSQSGPLALPSPLAAGQVTSTSKLSKTVDAVLGGKVALLLDGHPRAWFIDAKGFKTRNPEAPTTEQDILGSKEGFVEDLRANTSMIRRRIKDRNLQLVEMTVGRKSRTRVTVIYLADVANPALVTAVLSRLHAIDAETVASANALAAYVKDHNWSPFPVAELTERPDVVAMEVLDGRVGILVENDPFAVLVPATFWDFFQAADDYNQGALGATLGRLVRFLAFFLSTFLPGLYTAFVMIHLDLVPFDLALSVAGSRQGVPFPAPLEYFFLIIMFEVMREVSIRIPKTMGATIGVVGGIVLGQAVVQAGVVSAPLIVVVALVALALFTTPHYQMTVMARMLSLISLAVGSALGVYGILLAAMAVIVHLASLTSFDVPYLAPAAPASRGFAVDTLTRAPLWSLRRRPYQYQPTDVRKRDDYRTPMPYPDLEEARS
ncbi:MAG: spore germination protein [Firmicutes bacterium]|nr:spore germination protein [Bacillota bacterium]